MPFTNPNKDPRLIILPLSGTYLIPIPFSLCRLCFRPPSAAGPKPLEVRRLSLRMCPSNCRSQSLILIAQRIVATSILYVVHYTSTLTIALRYLENLDKKDRVTRKNTPVSYCSDSSIRILLQCQGWVGVHGIKCQISAHSRVMRLCHVEKLFLPSYVRNNRLFPLSLLQGGFGAGTVRGYSFLPASTDRD
jgi:hypothetical protein